MADDSQVVRGIDWKSTLPFTQIFRSFRIAIHPSKLILALVALLLIYTAGRVLDGIWPRRASAVPGEVEMYERTRSQPNGNQLFQTERTRTRTEIQDMYSAELARLNLKADDGLGAIKDALIKERDDITNRAKTATSQPTEAEEAARDQVIAAAYANASEQYRAAKAIKGVGLFESFMRYQTTQAQRVVTAGASGRWTGRDGVFDEFINLLTVAPFWGLRYHPIYFIIFLIIALVIWAIFGGAIARIAAVQVARDEKISVRQALSFSTAKFLSFLSAPIIPIGIIVIVGLVVSFGALLLFNIPFLGPILGGLLFFLALAAGFVMTLVLIGLVGGFNLMYPTIAVEGSDSFDAISRSFSYLFARPWRLLFYSLLAIIYGALCYLFVCYFVRLMLALTHTFVGWGIFTTANGNGAIPSWPVMWPNPLTSPSLTYDIDFISLATGQDIGAGLVAFWVYLVISMIGAFLISFYFSANTIIYVLMRQEVDATEVDDVYLEQTDEEFTETVSSTATVTTVTSASGPAEQGQPIPEAPPAAAPDAGNVPPPEHSPYQPDNPPPGDQTPPGSP
jgi:hypothetical protein